MSEPKSVQVTRDYSKMRNEELIDLCFVENIIFFFVFGAIGRGGPWPPHSRGF